MEVKGALFEETFVLFAKTRVGVPGGAGVWWASTRPPLPPANAPERAERKRRSVLASPEP